MEKEIKLKYVFQKNTCVSACIKEIRGKVGGRTKEIPGGGMHKLLTFVLPKDKSTGRHLFRYIMSFSRA